MLQDYEQEMPEVIVLKDKLVGSDQTNKDSCSEISINVQWSERPLSNSHLMQPKMIEICTNFAASINNVGWAATH